MGNKNINAKSAQAQLVHEGQLNRLRTERHKNDGLQKPNSYGIEGKYMQPAVIKAVRNWVNPEQIARAEKQGRKDGFFTRHGVRYTFECKCSLMATFAQDNRYTGADINASLRDLLGNDFLVFDTKNIIEGYSYTASADSLLDSDSYDFSTVRVAPCAEFVKLLLDNDLIYYTETTRACLYKGRNVYGKNAKGEYAVLSKKRYTLLWELINKYSMPWNEFLRWRWSRK